MQNKILLPLTFLFFLISAVSAPWVLNFGNGVSVDTKLVLADSHGKKHKEKMKNQMKKKERMKECAKDDKPCNDMNEKRKMMKKEKMKMKKKGTE